MTESETTKMTNQELIALADHHVAKTYGRYPVALVRGEE